MSFLEMFRLLSVIGRLGLCPAGFGGIVGNIPIDR
jgi:hypothetical protein